MNLATLFCDHPADRTAIIAGGDHISFGRLEEEVARTRGLLTSLGLQPDDRVGILCGTNFRFVRAWFGIIGAGMVAVPLNPQSPGPELEREVNAVGLKAIIAGPAGVATLSTLDRSATPALEHVLVPAGTDMAGSVDLDTLREGVEPTPLVERADDDLAVLMFTSGTAGAPKAARLTHGNLASSIRMVQATPGQVTRPDDVGLCVVPLFHILGLNSILNQSLYVGSLLILQERFDPMTVFETVAEHQVSVLVGPPTMWAALSQVDLVPDDALSSVRIAVSGAAALPSRVVEEMMGRFGVRVLEGYGLTEASPSVTLARENDTPVGSIGRPVAGIEIRLVDGDGDDVYIGDEGEIWVRGPNVFGGYDDDPEATARALDADGWLHTGDIAVVDDDGYLFLVDRAKDLIIVSGFNVFPAEVERVLVAHPAIDEAAVIGIPHPYTGETVKAFVVPKAGRVVEEDDLVRWCATELARYKCPSKVDIVDELPKGLGGKVLRQQLGR